MNPLISINLTTIGMLALMGTIPYFIWMVYASCKRHWGLLGIQVAIPLLFVGLVHKGAIGLTLENHFRWADHFSSDYLKSVFDADVALGEPLFEGNAQDRGFNGDGYCVIVYALPAEIAKKFAAADGAWMGDFPKWSPSSAGWRAEHWRKGPLEMRFQKYLDFATSFSDGRCAPELAAHFAAVREALAGDGVYYAFFHRDNGERPSDIDLFVVDVARKRLYMINLNT